MTEDNDRPPSEVKEPEPEQSIADGLGVIVLFNPDYSSLQVVHSFEHDGKKYVSDNTQFCNLVTLLNRDMDSTRTVEKMLNEIFGGQVNLTRSDGVAVQVPVFEFAINKVLTELAKKRDVQNMKSMITKLH